MASTLPVALARPRWASHPLLRLLAPEALYALDEPPFDLDSAYDALVMERAVAAEGSALPQWALAAFYRLRGAIPRWLQLALRRALIKRQGMPDFPRWPYDESVRDLLAAFVAASAAPGDEIRFRWFWPNRSRAALALTHDVESRDGLRNALRIADLETARGFCSSFNVVKCRYEIDYGILRELADRGFEIGVHGIWHDRSLFSTRAEFEVQRDLLSQAAEAFGAVGFRSPATYRVPDWLAELPFEYDCTVPLSDPYEPQPGGCCSPWPYFIGDMVELPWTLPQDHTLFTLLRHRDIALWVAQVERLRDAAGLIEPLTHPDPGYLGERRNERLYEAFLDRMAEQPDLWVALPRDIARWWRHRDSADAWPGSDYGTVSLTKEGRLAFEAPR